MNNEWEQIKEKLACHHSIFYKIVEIGKPSFTDSISIGFILTTSSGFTKYIFFEKTE